MGAVKTEPMLEIKDLCVRFSSRDSAFEAVRGVSLSVNAGEVVAVVGESGSGKSVTSLSILKLVASPPGRITGGEIRFHENDLLSYSERQMRQIRGNQIAMIFQEPMSSLNPVMTVAAQMAEALREHTQLSRSAIRERIVELLRLVQIPSPERHLSSYPHELSGGMRQRIMIAMALACNPQLLIADEPTTALDVTVQAQILDLMRLLQEQLGMAMILVTHDLAVVATIATRVFVMYAGTIVEEGPTERILKAPIHPYTQGLLAAIPGSDKRKASSLAGSRRRLTEIPGSPPDLSEPLRGCPFAPRCQLADERCRTETPRRRQYAETHMACCHKGVVQ